MTMPKQATQKFSWGLHCPICKNEEHGEEDWDGNLKNQPRMCSQNLQPQTTQNPQLQNLNAHSHKPLSIPNHKAVNMLRNEIPSCRTIKNQLTFWIGVQKR